MTLMLLPHVRGGDHDLDAEIVHAAALDRHYGVIAATQMLRSKEVTPLQYLALCEEAAELADAEAHR